ncbi:hypothetical protein [Nonomuraea longicatena]|uniref:Uncharacterized protein n=1 Tax=Nonomuraea longicatena TaxID=83682 RepID=A0ABP4BHU7_9ACTN
MPQVRVIGDDPDHVDQVVTLILALINASPHLIAGDPTRLRHRGGGGRVVFDVTVTDRRTTPEPAPTRVHAERVDNLPTPRSRRTPPRRALPPA